MKLSEWHSGFSISFLLLPYSPLLPHLLLLKGNVPREAKTILQIPLPDPLPNSLLWSLCLCRWFSWWRVYPEEVCSSPLHAEGFGLDMFRIICPCSHDQVPDCILGQALRDNRPQSEVEGSLDHPTGFLEGLKPFAKMPVSIPSYCTESWLPIQGNKDITFAKTIISRNLK